MLIQFLLSFFFILFSFSSFPFCISNSFYNSPICLLLKYLLHFFLYFIHKINSFLYLHVLSSSSSCFSHVTLTVLYYFVQSSNIPYRIHNVITESKSMDKMGNQQVFLKHTDSYNRLVHTYGNMLPFSIYFSFFLFYLSR